MFEMSEAEILEEVANKRHSLQEQCFFPRNKRHSETEDEGVDAGTSSSSMDEQTEQCLRPASFSNIKTDVLLSSINCDELHQLEEFLKLSGISCSDPEDLDEEGIMNLRSYVSKFLALKINQECGEHFGGKKSVSFAEKANMPAKVDIKPPNNSPNVSAFKHFQVCHFLYSRTLKNSRSGVVVIKICKRKLNFEVFHRCEGNFVSRN